jgi:NADPH2:quinone reductase
MRAARIVRLDGPSAVRLDTVAEPVATANEVLIDVHAAGVSFPDVLMTRGLYQSKPELPFIPGAEVAGVVRFAPANSGFAPGDRVAGSADLGGYAESVLLRPSQVLPLPAGLSFVHAAALPINYLTMQFALVRRGRLEPGETVLVHGAAGGVGTATIQLAKVLGAKVIAVVSTAAKAEVASKAGADDVVFASGFLTAVKELTGGRGVDLIVDPVGGDRFTDSLRALAPEGRLLVLGFTAGEIPTVKVNRLLLNNISVVGVGWGAFLAPRPELVREQWAELVPHIASGALLPPVDAIYPLSDAAAALTVMDERGAHGKIVLTVR